MSQFWLGFLAGAAITVGGLSAVLGAVCLFFARLDAQVEAERFQ